MTIEEFSNAEKIEEESFKKEIGENKAKTRPKA